MGVPCSVYEVREGLSWDPVGSKGSWGDRS